LVSTDFSELANRAIPFAYDLVRDGGKVHLLHVLEPDPLIGPLYAHYTPPKLDVPEERERAIARVTAELERLIPGAAASRHVTTTVNAVLHGAVGKGLVDEALARRADVIVIASHGRTGLGRLVLGSVAQQVVQSSPVPVLVIPPARD
jgi:nucleotide-binding universal stress UspA family protein